LTSDWSEKFSNKLEAKQQARQAARRDFQAYSTAVRGLFDWVEKKVKGISAIQVDRPVMARNKDFGADVAGPIDMIKSLKLSCGAQVVELVPEGINTPYGMGRLRLRHRAKRLNDYLFLYLISDAASERPYPENLIWVINDQGDNQPPAEFGPFDDAVLENLIEAAFLE